MAAYAIGHIRDLEMGPPIVDYLERIDATLAPFGGRFLVHGARPEVLEGQWVGDLVVIEFPDLERARRGTGQLPISRLLRFRIDNSNSEIILLGGVDRSHRATDIPASPAEGRTGDTARKDP